MFTKEKKSTKHFQDTRDSIMISEGNFDKCIPNLSASSLYDYHTQNLINNVCTILSTTVNTIHISQHYSS